MLSKCFVSLHVIVKNVGPYVYHLFGQIGNHQFGLCKHLIYYSLKVVVISAGKPELSVSEVICNLSLD